MAIATEMQHERADLYFRAMAGGNPPAMSNPCVPDALPELQILDPDDLDDENDDGVDPIEDALSVPGNSGSLLGAEDLIRHDVPNVPIPMDVQMTSTHGSAGSVNVSAPNCDREITDILSGPVSLPDSLPSDICADLNHENIGEIGADNHAISDLNSVHSARNEEDTTLTQTSVLLGSAAIVNSSGPEGVPIPDEVPLPETHIGSRLPPLPPVPSDDLDDRQPQAQEVSINSVNRAQGARGRKGAKGGTSKPKPKPRPVSTRAKKTGPEPSRSNEEGGDNEEGGAAGILSNNPFPPTEPVVSTTVQLGKRARKPVVSSLQSYAQKMEELERSGKRTRK
jgi:hypothetical protein